MDSQPALWTPRPAIIRAAPRELLRPSLNDRMKLGLIPGFCVPGILEPAAPYSNLAWVQSATLATSTTTYTFSAQPIGTAAADRWVIVGAIVVSSSITGVTIGGITATQIEYLSSTAPRLGFWAALVPTGTTANIVVTTSTSANGMHIGYWTVNMSSGVPLSSFSNASGSSTSVSLGAQVLLAGQFGLAISAHSDTTDRVGSNTSGGLTKDGETFSGYNAAFWRREATLSTTVAFSWPSASTSFNCTGAFASWQ